MSQSDYLLLGPGQFGGVISSSVVRRALIVPLWMDAGWGAEECVRAQHLAIGVRLLPAGTHSHSSGFKRPSNKPHDCRRHQPSADCLKRARW